MSENKEELKGEELEDNAKEQVEEDLEKQNDSKEDSEAEKEEVDPIDQLEAEKSEIQDKYLRLYSEFENYRRRTAKERVDLIQQASKDLIVELLPVIDDFERAMDSMEKSGDNDGALDGVKLIYNKFKSTLERKGLTPMDSLNKDFDPELHEALTKMPTEDKKMKGKVFDVIEKGYTLHNKVIRHAKVVVAE